MKIIRTVGANAFAQWTQTRTACRAVVLREGQILLSYETVTGQWMVPGGGIDEGETEEACVVRETAEETGVLIRPSACLLRMEEYYEEWRYVTLYFGGEAAGTVPRRLTERERAVGMEPRWIPVAEALRIFGAHADWAATDEMRRGIYLREYTALREILGGQEA